MIDGSNDGGVVNGSNDGDVVNGCNDDGGGVNDGGEVNDGGGVIGSNDEGDVKRLKGEYVTSGGECCNELRVGVKAWTGDSEQSAPGETCQEVVDAAACGL